MDGIDLINLARKQRTENGLAVVHENTSGDHVTYYAKDEADKQGLIEHCKAKGLRIIQS